MDDFVKSLELPRNQAIIAALLLVAAALLRLPSLTLNSFWADELLTANIVLSPLDAQLSMLWRDQHPPLFYFLVYLWRLCLGSSEWVLRLMPALIGIITVPISFLLFRKQFGSFTAFAIAVLILFLPAHIYYSHELRSYSLSFLLAGMLTAMLFRYLSDPSTKHRWILAAACAALFGTHYIGLFYVLTVLFIGAMWIDSEWRIKWQKALRLNLAALALLIPFLPHFVYQWATMESYWPLPVRGRRVAIMMGFLFQYDILLAATYLCLIAVAIWSALYGKDRALSSKIWAGVVLSICPLLGVIAVSLISQNTSVLIPRIMMVFGPSVILLAAMGLSCINDKRISTMVLLLCSILSIWWLYSSGFYTVPTKSDFRGATKEISQLEKERENVLLISLDRKVITYEQNYDYYFKMFGVSSDVLFMQEEMSEEEILRRIHKAAVSKKTNTLAVFSMHIPVLNDVLETCDKHFEKEYEKTFVSPAHFGHTFVASYRLDWTDVHEQKGSCISRTQNP